MSPHKFRHGHALYGLLHARDMADVKALSQNLMHANIGITDSIYAVLSSEDQRERIRGLGGDQPGDGLEDVIGQIEALLGKLKARP